MDTLIHADIFFFVTTIAVVLVAAVFTIALIYLIKILSDLRHVTRQVREEAVLLRTDLREVRESIRQEGFKLKSFFALFSKLFGHNSKGRRIKRQRRT